MKKLFNTCNALIKYSAITTCIIGAGFFLVTAVPAYIAHKSQQNALITKKAGQVVPASDRLPVASDYTSGSYQSCVLKDSAYHVYFEDPFLLSGNPKIVIITPDGKPYKAEALLSGEPNSMAYRVRHFLYVPAIKNYRPLSIYFDYKHRSCKLLVPLENSANTESILYGNITSSSF